MNFKPGSIVNYKGEVYNLHYGTTLANGSEGQYICASELGNPNRSAVSLPPSAATEFTPFDWNTPEGAKILPSSVYKLQYMSTSGATGADPEIFAFTPHGKVIPAWEFLPAPAPDKQQYWDGVQAEFTPTHMSCHEALTDNVRLQLKATHQQLQAKFPDAHLAPQDVVKLPKQLLVEGEEAHLKLGCGKSWNAYDIPAIDVGDYRALPYRFAGSHFHCSLAAAGTARWKCDWFPKGTVVMMDKIAGLLLTALGRDLENPVRRKYYGRPGEFRVPNRSNFHLEYRTPSNFILWAPGVYNFAADVTRFAYRMGLYADGSRFPLPDVQEIITNCDADAAVKVIGTHKEFFSKMFGVIYPSISYPRTSEASDVTKSTFAALTEGLKSFASLGKTSIVDAWRLETDEYASYNDRHSLGWRQFCLQGVK